MSLTRRANQQHNSIIPKFAIRQRARSMDATMFRVARSLRMSRHCLREDTKPAKIKAVSEPVRESHTHAV
jgi:hypothetical protein